MCKHPLVTPHSLSSPSPPTKVLPKLLAGGKFRGHTYRTHRPGFSPHVWHQPSLSTCSAPGGAEVIAPCSETVKFLPLDLFWDVIKMFHGQLCQKKKKKL